jgi:hypothetical protein
MQDPYCAWNIKKNLCDSLRAKSSTSEMNNLLTLNPQICSRLQRQENVKSIQLDGASSFALLECHVKDEYLYDFIEWRKGQEPIDFNHANNSNMFLTWKKGCSNFPKIALIFGVHVLN